MTLYLLCGILATWRVSVALVYDPVFKGLRDRLGVGMENENGDPISFWSWMCGCMWCCTVPVSFIVTLMVLLPYIYMYRLFPVDVITWPFALSGGAILLHYYCRIHLVLGGYHDG